MRCPQCGLLTAQLAVATAENENLTRQVARLQRQIRALQQDGYLWPDPGHYDRT